MHDGGKAKISRDGLIAAYPTGFPLTRQGQAGMYAYRQPGIRLDLLADGFVTEEEAIEVLVALAEEDLLRLEVEPAQDAKAGLVEVAPDRGVGGTPRVEEAGGLSGIRGIEGGHDPDDASRAHQRAQRLRIVDQALRCLSDRSLKADPS